MTTQARAEQIDAAVKSAQLIQIAAYDAVGYDPHDPAWETYGADAAWKQAMRATYAGYRAYDDEILRLLGSLTDMG